MPKRLDSSATPHRKWPVIRRTQRRPAAVAAVVPSALGSRASQWCVIERWGATGAEERAAYNASRKEHRSSEMRTLAQKRKDNPDLRLAEYSRRNKQRRATRAVVAAAAAVAEAVAVASSSSAGPRRPKAQQLIDNVAAFHAAEAAKTRGKPAAAPAWKTARRVSSKRSLDEFLRKPPNRDLPEDTAFVDSEGVPWALCRKDNVHKPYRFDQHRKCVWTGLERL